MKYSHWFLIIAAVAILYVFFKGGDDKYQRSARINYDTVAVSDRMTAEARGLDLEKDLDVSLLPDIGKQSIREAAQAGLKEQAFLQHVMRGVSNRVREISTIDLNSDGTADPILIKPEPAGDEGYVLLSLEVPAPGAYPLPSAGDQAAWKKVETLEVATMTVALNDKELTVQARGNRHMYPNSYGNNYYAHDRSGSFLQTYIALRMASWMFYPRYYGFYGAGYGYGFYRPYGVGMIRGSRGGVYSSRGYSRAASSRTPAVRSRSGAAPRSAYSRAYSKTPPKSLNQLRSSRSFSRRQGGSTAAGGFGRGRSGSGSRQFRPTSRYASQRSTSRGFGGFGRGSSRSFFGGGGRRFGK
jgi:hypothetical protein